MNIYFAVIILAFSLATSSTALADREQAAMNAQKMADAQQRQADAADNAAWDAEMRAVKNPTTSNMMESWIGKMLQMLLRIPQTQPRLWRMI